MTRKKILAGPIQLGDTSLEEMELADAFEDSQLGKRRRSDLQRWRKLKHQLA